MDFVMVSRVSSWCQAGLGESPMTTTNKNEQIWVKPKKMGIFRHTKNGAKSGKYGIKLAYKTEPWQNTVKPKVLPNFGLGSPNSGVKSIVKVSHVT